MYHLLDNESWDFFQCHIMETDRLQHFLWEPMERGDPVYAPRFMAFFDKVDRMLGEVGKRLDEDTTFIVVSDHGFCSIKKEVYVNHWLQERGWLSLPDGVANPMLEHIAPTSRAFCLDPGRIFINLKGREQDGCVAPGAEYEALRAEIAAAALELKDPDTGEAMVQQVLRREDIYYGPCTERAADLIWVPTPGYDPKGAFGKGSLTYKGDVLVGMHTFDDAMLGIANWRLGDGEMSLVDVMPIILEEMGVPVPADVDGRS
jgi:predicted AlkP superfamily phosphohydrolase/phosphomutase